METVLELMKEYENILWLTGIVSMFTFMGTLIVLPIMVARLPVDYLIVQKEKPDTLQKRHPVLRLIILVFRNLMGILLILAGITMLVLPGEGIITILIGFALLSFPQKESAIKRIVQQKRILRTANWIRIKLNKPPLLSPENDQNAIVADDLARIICQQD
ncbi:MAG: hypothetical protein E3K37_18545 [Candidatus Kuenenia sp.]|nr:hypothetical protein [Candidatus Kuenenia hertensis]